MTRMRIPDPDDPSTETILPARPVGAPPSLVPARADDDSLPQDVIERWNQEVLRERELAANRKIMEKWWTMSSNERRAASEQWFGMLRRHGGSQDPRYNFATSMPAISDREDRKSGLEKALIDLLSDTFGEVSRQISLWRGRDPEQDRRAPLIIKRADPGGSRG
jgi:hypothetical protein